MKLKSLFLATAVFTGIVLSGCGSTTTTSGSTNTGTGNNNNASNAGGKVQLSFPTGTTTGVYYPLGAGLAKLWNDKLPNVSVASQASNGSVQNLNFMQKGEAKIALTPIGTLWEAYNGKVSFDGRPYPNVRVIAALYPNVDQFLIRKGAANGVADLKGKSFVPGATASATEIDSKRILEAYGITYKDIKNNFVGFTEAVDLMRNKQVAGTMIQAGLPTAAVTEIMSTADGQLISLDDDKIKALQDKYPWFVEFTIPAKTYDGQDKDIKTVAQPNMLVVDASMPDDLAYQLTKTLMESLKELEKTHSVMKYVTLENATKGLAGVPLHPGAEKFYKEKGVLK